MWDRAALAGHTYNYPPQHTPTYPPNPHPHPAAMAAKFTPPPAQAQRSSVPKAPPTNPAGKAAARIPFENAAWALITRREPSIAPLREVIGGMINGVYEAKRRVLMAPANVQDFLRSDLLQRMEHLKEIQAAIAPIVTQLEEQRDELAKANARMKLEEVRDELAKAKIENLHLKLTAANARLA